MVEKRKFAKKTSRKKGFFKRKDLNIPPKDVEQSPPKQPPKPASSSSSSKSGRSLPKSLFSVPSGRARRGRHAARKLASSGVKESFLFRHGAGVGVLNLPPVDDPTKPLPRLPSIFGKPAKLAAPAVPQLVDLTGDDFERR